MAFLKHPLLRENWGSEDKVGSNSETKHPMMDLELGTIQPAPGQWLFPKNPDHCCIYRVPKNIRKVNPEAYTPQLLIIGPLHYSLKSQALRYVGDITNTKFMGYLNMEEHKKIYLSEFTQRVKEKKIIDEFRRIIEEDEEIIRTSYSESTDWIKSMVFVDMILHDAVFILEFMLRCYAKGLEKRFPKDPLMSESCLEKEARKDLILLENQLPYFILEKIFDPIVSKLIPDYTFRKLVITHFGCKGQIRDNLNFRHFTDLYRLIRVETLPPHTPKEVNITDRLIRVETPPPHTPKEVNIIEYMHNADKLYSGGVEFEAVQEKEFSMHVRFENGCLKMPCLRIADEDEMILRNIMALEQCHYPINAYVCNYVIFMDHLIDTHKDVDLLVEKGIIQNWIGHHGLVAEMVNKLGLGILEDDSYYYDIAVAVNDHYSNPVNRSRALLKRVYFGNLWTGTATVAATLLLLMTLTQTITSIIQVIQKK